MSDNFGIRTSEQMSFETLPENRSIDRAWIAHNKVIYTVLCFSVCGMYQSAQYWGLEMRILVHSLALLSADCIAAKAVTETRLRSSTFR